MNAKEPLLDNEQRMTDLSIAYDGARYYYYGSYRYEHLEDAINYAQRKRWRSSGPEKVPMPTVSLRAEASVEDRETMTEMGITYGGGIYRLGEYRYDHLEDALAYANRRKTSE